MAQREFIPPGTEVNTWEMNGFEYPNLESIGKFSSKLDFAHFYYERYASLQFPICVLGSCLTTKCFYGIGIIMP